MKSRKAKLHLLPETNGHTTSERRTYGCTVSESWTHLAVGELVPYFRGHEVRRAARFGQGTAAYAFGHPEVGEPDTGVVVWIG